MALLTSGRRLVAAATTLLPGLTLPLGVNPAAASNATGNRGDWPTWQGDLRGSRHNAAERAITPASAGRLELKWAYAYPKSDLPVKSQPAVAGNTIFFGGPEGEFHARDARTGAAKWNYVLKPDGAALDGPAVARGKVFFGGSNGYVYALDQRTGRVRWATGTETHAAALHTSSPLYHDGLVYIGASSGENTGGADYPCCTFRGHIDALDAETGALVWRYYTVPEPVRVGSWPSGAARYEPSGAAAFLLWRASPSRPGAGLVRAAGQRPPRRAT